MTEQNQTDHEKFAAEVGIYLETINNDATASFATFLDTVKHNPSSASWSEAERLDALATHYQKQYQDIANTAEALAQKSVEMNDSAQAAVWHEASEQAAEWAGQRKDMSSEAYIRRAHELTKGNVGKYLGPVGDALDAGEVVAWEGPTPVMGQ